MVGENEARVAAEAAEACCGACSNNIRSTKPILAGRLPGSDSGFRVSYSLMSLKCLFFEVCMKERKLNKRLGGGMSIGCVAVVLCWQLVVGVEGSSGGGVEGGVAISTPDI